MTIIETIDTARTETVFSVLESLSLYETDVRYWWMFRNTPWGKAEYRRARNTFAAISQRNGGGKTPMHFTTQDSSAKTAHNADVTDKAEQIVQYMLPHRLSGFVNICPWSTPECRATCLHTSGRLGMAEIAKLVRTEFFATEPYLFQVSLLGEIERHAKRVNKCGKQLIIRFNGTGDVPIEYLPYWFELVSEVEVDIAPLWFDYTKGVLTNAKRRRKASPRPDYYTVASGTERTTQDVASQYDGNIVFVVAAKPGSPLPSEFWGREVIDGDRHDMRCFDEQGGKAVLVRSKGDARGIEGRDDSFIKPIH